MGIRAIVLGAALALQACALQPPVPAAADAAAVPWQDQRFGYSPSLVEVTRESLFALGPDLLASLRAQPVIADGNQATRTAELLRLVFGPELKAFAYAGGHSTPAAETWRNRRGDCLSLSIMSLALARALDLPAQIQEVRVPVVFDRRGGVDFVNQHVNLLVRNERELRAIGRTLPAGYIVVDFEPQAGTRRKGQALQDHQVLARFLNNLASEQMAGGDDRSAYAHFKAAIQADAGYPAAYGNLAQLYLRVGLNDDAEQLLRRAMLLDDDTLLAMAALHRLLLDQGRTAEAQRYEALLQSRREQDPYYWLGLGLERLQRSQVAQAVDALERAQASSQGFDEVHRYLAIAYWRAGRLHQARDQLARLGASGATDAKLAWLSSKLGSGSAGGLPPPP